MVGECATDVKSATSPGRPVYTLMANHPGNRTQKRIGIAMDKPPKLRSLAGRPYRQAVASLWDESAIWDYLRYDDDGQLWVNDLRVIDAVGRYGSPLEIVDTTLVERRAREWMDLSRAVAEETGYPGRLGYLYAAKANMASEVAHAAYRAGWHAETSSSQDLTHLAWLHERGLLPEGLRVACNGFKLPPALYGRPASDTPPAASRITLPENTLSAVLRDTAYADQIVEFARRGWDITPILDSGELAHFSAPGNPEMNVGLRLRCGPARSMADLDRLESRFGMDRHELAAAASAIAQIPHLRLTTFHAMVGAAQTIPVPTFVESLLLAARIWATLRREHEALREFDMGGGVPPLGEPYDHRGFLRNLFEGLIAVSREADVPPPDFTFEFGSLVAAESSFHVFKVILLKEHGRTGGDQGRRWAIVDGGLMAAIPDMLLIDRQFRFLAVNDTDRPAQAVLIGDPSCDSDGRYPPSNSTNETAVLLPSGAGQQYVLIQGVGAYQEILAGVRGAHHCGLLEAIELILEPGPGGEVRARLMPRQTRRDAAAVLGYTEAAAGALKAAMGRSSE